MHRYVNMITTSLRWSKPDQVQRVRNTFVSASKSSPSDCYLLILFFALKIITQLDVNTYLFMLLRLSSFLDISFKLL